MFRPPGTVCCHFYSFYFVRALYSDDNRMQFIFLDITMLEPISQITLKFILSLVYTKTTSGGYLTHRFAAC